MFLCLGRKACASALRVGGLNPAADRMTFGKLFHPYIRIPLSTQMLMDTLDCEDRDIIVIDPAQHRNDCIDSRCTILTRELRLECSIAL